MLLEDHGLHEVDDRAGGEFADEKVGDVEHAEEERDAPDRMHRDGAEPLAEAGGRHGLQDLGCAEELINRGEPFVGDRVAERLREARLGALADRIELFEMRGVEE